MLLLITLANLTLLSSACAKRYVLRGRTNCPNGSDSCNAAATDLTHQLEKMNHALEFKRFPIHMASNMWGPYVDDDQDANGNIAHPQGLVQTNKVDGKWYFAFSYSEKNGNGSISFASRRTNGEKWIDYIFERNTWHPSSMAQIGKYVLWVENHRVYVMDITRLKEYAGREPPAVIHPSDYKIEVPYLKVLGKDELGTGGGGVAIVQLANGDYLLAVGIQGGESDVQVRMHILRGSLAKPEAMTSRWIADLDLSCDPKKRNCAASAGKFGNRNGTVLHMRLADGSPAIPQRDENLSMVTDTSGRIFLYVPDREGKGKDRFYWYRLSASMTSPQVVTADGIYAIDSSHVSCWYQGGTSARVDADGVLQLMCGEHDFSRAEKNDLRMYFWMHPCDGDGYRTWGAPSACTSP
jgi:hypothetical protein